MTGAEMNQFSKGEKVVLVSFLGVQEKPSDTQNNEDYWRLIGEVGEVISETGKVHPAFPERGERVLVQFVYANIRGMGLECHNPNQNSLWMFSSDLQLCSDE